MESIWDQILSDKKEDDLGTELDFLPNISLADFKKRNMGVLVYSKYLDDEIWFCSNQIIANQILTDDSQTITYTIDELANLIRLKPDVNSLKSIHEAKKMFNNSKAVAIHKKKY